MASDFTTRRLQVLAFRCLRPMLASVRLNSIDGGRAESGAMRQELDPGRADTSDGL